MRPLRSGSAGSVCSGSECLLLVRYNEAILHESYNLQSSDATSVTKKEKEDLDAADCFVISKLTNTQSPDLIQTHLFLTTGGHDAFEQSSSPSS